MKNLFVYMVIITAALCINAGASAAELPKYFKGKIVAEAKKPEWTPDGKGISFTKGNTLFVYDLSKGKSKKLAEMFVAEYTWLNNDSALVIQWPENIRDRKKVSKIVNYWIIERSGKKHLLAADTSITNRIPDYNQPFNLSKDVVALRKEPGWQISDFPQNEEIIAFASNNYDLKNALDNYFYPTWSDQERGSIHFKNIDGEIIKTLALGENYYNPELSKDRSKMFVYSNKSAVIMDTTGNILADLGSHIDQTQGNEFKKFMGAQWNGNSDAVAFFEIYDKPEDYRTISCYNLDAEKIVVLTGCPYYGQNDLRFSPDGKLLAAHLVYKGTDFIVLMDLPEPEADARR